MTDRIIFAPNGLRISKPGVSVSSAGRKDLIFRAEDRSIPLLSRMSGSLPASFTIGLVLYYPKVFSSPPLSIIYYNSSQPSGTDPLYVLSGLGNSHDYSWPWSYDIGTGHTGAIAVERYTDRIEVKNILNAVSGSGVSPVSGWISVVLFDYS